MAAWRGGHKEKCNALKSRYSEFLSSLHFVDDAHKADAPPIVDGLSLCDAFDYKILGTAFATGSPYFGPSEENKEPSMKNFYDHLGRAFRGEWWFYEDTDGAAYQEAASSHEEEVDYFIALSLFMCYDYHGSFLMRARDDFGAAMPAARFIEMYASARTAEDSVDRFRLRREARTICILGIMETFHK